MQPKQKYQNAKAEFNRKVEDQSSHVNEQDAALLKEFVDAYHPDIRPTGNALRAPPTDKKQTRAYNTLANYYIYIGAFIERTGLHLETMAADDINETANAMLENAHTGWDSPSRNTVRNYVGPLKKFYWFHREHRTDISDVYEDINGIPTRPTTVEPRDMWEREEITAMRGEITNSRDRALFEFLLNTGQRIQAALTLRVKDVDVDKGRFYLNPSTIPEASGLKGADKNGLERPLLGARAYMKRWLDDHPDSDNPEAFIFCALDSWGRTDDEWKAAKHHILDTTARRILKRIAKRAGVTKPSNPHAFRHNFVTIAHGEGMDPDTIRWMLGHGEGSRVMETTYKHLKNGEYIDNAEVAWGLKERETTGKLTPAYCPTCSLAPEPGAKFCDNCGEQFALDQMKEAKAEDAVFTSKGEAETPTEEQGVDLVRQILRDDPTAKSAMLAELEDELYERMVERMNAKQ